MMNNTASPRLRTARMGLVSLVACVGVQLPACAALAAEAASQASDGAWESYGGDPGGQRFAADFPITTQNVSGLEEAWTFRTGDVSDGEGESS